jgi:hypothetical protein
MAYRYRMQSTAKYGHYNDVVSTLRQVNEISSQRGWAVGRILSPFVGDGNVVVLETDYPDLATFEREMNEFYADAEAMKIWRSGAEHVVEGSNRDELYLDAPTLA